MNEQMLTVSTANISKKTAKWLDKQAAVTRKNKMDLIVYPKGEYGWFIPLYDDMLEAKEIPKDLVLVIGYALGTNCSWIMFDRDVHIIQQLHTFDW